MWILLLNWAGILRSPVCCSCSWIKSLARAMCVMRLPVASRQPLSGLDILLSSALPSTHPSSSGCNHPSENATSMESEGSAPVLWQTRKEITYHSQTCDCRILPVSPASSRKVSKLVFFPSLYSIHFPPQNIKWRWEAHCLVIISQGWSPLSASELCLICLGRC